MAGAVGGGGLGAIAINYGYHRKETNHVADGCNFSSDSPGLSGNWQFIAKKCDKRMVNYCIRYINFI